MALPHINEEEEEEEEGEGVVADVITVFGFNIEIGLKVDKTLPHAVEFNFNNVPVK